MKCSLVLFSWMVTCLLATLPTLAHQGVPPQTLTNRHLEAEVVDTLFLGSVDSQALLAEDALRFEKAVVGQAPAPVRFALPIDLKVTPHTHGTWTELPNGRLWRLEVQALGATDLNFGFSKFRIPPGATLYVISPKERYYQGPYTRNHVRNHGQLWTPMIPGEVGLIELFVPYGVKSMAQLELTRVGRGYRDVFGQGIGPALKQDSCNIDVVCPERAGWEDQIRSVGVYSINGSILCTGTLINNLAQDETPYFLTADHCGITSGSAASVVVYWNFESPTCGQLEGGTLSDTTTGATLRASDSENDMSLLELDSVPNAAYNVYYSGWDARTSTAPQSSVGIHHPNTDEKAISFNDDPLTTANNCIETSGSNTHWEVDNWEQGTTEPGSSGSALFDPATKRLVGYLSGGEALCSNPGGSDCYGKISVGWTRGLAAWLDPSSSGVRFVDGLDSGSGGGGSGGCTPSDTVLCLNGGRFQVEVTWTDFDANSGPGIDVGLGSKDSGLFWFFNAANWEMLIKVLNGCPINGHFWVFAAATTNVEYTLTVTDTQTSTVATYVNPLGVAAPAITDTQAFATCP